MKKIIYIVNCVYDDETGYGLNQRTFNTYKEAEDYAEETIENAESEYSTEVDREQNVYAVVTNRWNDARGFIEITSIEVDID